MSSPASSLPPHLNPPTISSNLSPTSRSRPSPTGSPQQSSSPRSSPRGGTTGMIDIEGLLRVNGGDCKKALEVVVTDRNNLQAQNSQLWKLIEKQRSQCASLASDNDRLRQDRERANHKLVSAGLDPVGHIRTINPSSSATGLGIQAAEIPKIRRNHSDRDDVARLDKIGKEKEHGGQSEKAEESGLSAPLEPQSSALLPSPISDRRTKRESRMVFPPEVKSYMTLVDSSREDSPKEGTQNTSVPSTSSADPSPQVVASPELRGPEHHGMVPPPSSKAFAATMAAEPPQPSPKSIVPQIVSRKNSAVSGVTLPIPSLESSTESVQSPAYSTRSETIASSMSESMQSSVSLDKLSRPSLDSAASIESSNHRTPRQSIDRTPQAHRQKDTLQQQQEVPSGAPRLSPALLPHARITIPSSTVFPNTSGRDVLCFIVEIVIRAPNAQPVTWNVAKLFSAFLDLDTRIKVSSKKNRKEWKQMVTPLPEGRSWKDFAPSKIDQRKAALEVYLQSLLVAPISDKTDLCHFLSTDPVQAKRHDARKEGYLTKKGKTLGGWKTRYFVLDGPVMEYFESRGGSHLGSITITNAQIGRQNRPIDSSDERDFRHAFLVIEAGKKGASHRHVLCAESDMERDRWIEILVKHVDPEPPSMSAPQPHPAALAPTTSPQPDQAVSQPAPASVNTPQAPAQQHQQQQGQQLRRKASQLRKHSKDGVVITNAQPLSGFANDAKFAGAPSPSMFNSMETQRALTQSPVSNAPAQTFPVPHVHATREQTPLSHPSRSNSSQEPPQQQRPAEKGFSASTPPETNAPGPVANEPTTKASKRQSMMPSKAPGFLSTSNQQGFGAHAPSPTAEKERDRKAKSRMFWGFGKTPEKITRPVFAVPLADSLAVASVANLPAIVFRCIEYLEAKKAEDEEGIYRLSGSSAVIKGLKERYDAEGDVNLLVEDEYWDPHAIAGLLKTFLRDLPTSLLTRELHTKFLAVMDLVDSSARISELGRLVTELPPPNYALLRALTAHLILVVQNSGINKMTLRNIGIVFSPTLGIPAGIFSELISNFGPIFDDEGEALDTRARPGEKDAAVVDSGLSALEDAEETVKRKRNSMLYQAGGADTMLGLTGRQLDSTEEDSSESDEYLDPDDPSTSTATHSIVPASSEAVSRESSYPSAAAVRKAKAAARDLAVDTQLNKDNGPAMVANGKGSGKAPDSGTVLSPK